MAELKLCIDCDCCLPIGEGDHWCDEMRELVIEDYTPTVKYGCCNQKKRKKIVARLARKDGDGL